MDRYRSRDNHVNLDDTQCAHFLLSTMILLTQQLRKPHACRESFQFTQVIQATGDASKSMNHEAIKEQVALPRNKDDPGISIPNKRQSQVGVMAVFEEGSGRDCYLPYILGTKKRRRLATMRQGPIESRCFVEKIAY